MQVFTRQIDGSNKLTLSPYFKKIISAVINGKNSLVKQVLSLRCIQVMNSLAKYFPHHLLNEVYSASSA
ncbi:MAG: hypothetical protein ACTS8H_02110 [Arsenophonus sp. NC-PE1-MAG3]